MMTFEEAKDVFLNHGWIKVEGGTYFDGSKWREAIMVLSDYLQREPCEDCISRQAVLEKQYRIDDSITLSTRDVVNVEDIEDLPLITPQPKIGRWIDADGDNAICACCNRLNHLYGTYCKHCGAKMQEVEE